MSTTTTAKPSQPAGQGSASAVLFGRRRVLGIVVALLVLVAAGATWALTRGSGSDSVPFKDALAVGTLTLCDADGHRVTSGSTKAKPFVARAVGATPVEGGAEQLAASGATLMAYQPRQGLGAGEWSGQQLTASSTFSSAKNPIAQATVEDGSLADFLVAFPARWDGLVHLRLYVASPTSGIAPNYSAVTVKVDGSSWSVVGKPGTASCTAGTATSFETTTNHVAPATH